MNLYLCLTPLQCIIAEFLIKKDKKTPALFLYIVDSDNEKSQTYFNRLKKISDESLYFVLSKNRMVNTLRLFFYIKKINHKINNVYLASIDNIYMHMALSYLKYDYIYTFDDGFANIYKKGLYYCKENYPYHKRFLYKMVGGVITMKEIKKRTQKHFSIYPATVPNIVPSELVEQINIFPVKKNKINFLPTKKPSTTMVKIFAGQPLFFGDDIRSKEMILMAISHIQPDYYFPHPRELFSIDLVENIKTSLIIEDFIIKYAAENPNLNFEVYSFFSSCLVNLYNVENVDVIAIKCSSLPYDDIYSLMDQFSIKILELSI